STSSVPGCSSSPCRWAWYRRPWRWPPWSGWARHRCRPRGPRGWTRWRRSGMSEPREVLRLEGLRKSYNLGRPNETEVLHGIDLCLDAADFAALVGPSGSGKSTLLNLVGLLDTPTDGELYLLGQATRAMDDEARTALRGQSIGFVFQFHHLITAFTALENVL